MSIKGLFHYEKVLDEDMIKKILKEINDAKWSDELGRRVQHYGYKYDYSIREPNVRKLLKITDPPKLIKKLGWCLYDLGLLNELPNQVIINEYLEGQGIGRHRDHHPIFGSSIATFTLQGSCEMDFEPYKDIKNKFNGIKKSVFLKRGDLVILKDDARYNFSHEIKKRKKDRGVYRGTRISLTYRRNITED